MATTDKLHDGLHILRYIAPATVLAYYILASTVSTCMLQNLKVRDHGMPYKWLLSLMVLVLLSFVLEASMLLTDTIDNEARYSSTDSNVYALSNVLVWMILLGCLDAKTSVWYPHCGTWFIALVAEIMLFVSRLSHGFAPTAFFYTQVIVQSCRIVVLILLPTILFTKCATQTTKDEETAPLLDQHKMPLPVTPSSRAYGSIFVSSNATDDEDEDEFFRKQTGKEKRVKETLLESGNWLNYARSFSLFVPLLWPSKQRMLQLNLFGVFVCLACERALNVLEPRQFGIVLDRLSALKVQGHVGTVVLEVLLFIVYSWIDAVVVGPLRSLLWTPIEQNAERALKTAAYNHVMDLSRDFHTEKQSGELYTSMDQGSSIIGILETAIFQVLPVFIDLVVAAAYLYYVFGPYMALILATTSIIFLWSSTWFLSKQTRIHRTLTKLARKRVQVMYDTVGGWDSVSHFNTVSYEKDRYSDAVGSQAIARLKEISIFYIAWMGEQSLMELGLVGASFLAVYQIAYGTVPIGSFAMLMSYWGSFSGHLYRIINTRSQFLAQLIDAEALRELFQRKPTVKNGSRPLSFKRGVVEFHGVGFSYDGEKEIIKNLSFRAESGQRVALVGETGGGKSTVLKLLFRFYDAQKGRITIDGQDVKDVTLQSLRDCIGVVPQDPSLFNTTIMENVRYSKLDATDAEVIDACKAAAIHDRINDFPKGYASKCGEKGIKLSGGELQRVAIARVILKNPKIILLDEATSAVDTDTEARIQGALQRLTYGRTTFTVAHRLGTVSDADIILVIKNGSIVERGPPDQLLKTKGEYFELLSKQIGITGFPKDDLKPNNIGDIIRKRRNRDKSRSSESSFSSASRSLRATAPEFVPRDESAPRGQRGSEVKECQLSHDHREPGHQQRRQSTLNTGFSHASTKSKVDREEKEPCQTKPLLHTSEHSSDVVTSVDQTDDIGDQTGAKKRNRKSYFQRRRCNKSEPTGPALKQTHVDGPIDRPSNTRLQSRRASAPSDVPSHLPRAPGETHGRRRRQRRWRIRDHDSPLSRTGTLAGEASTWLGATPHPATPSVPFTMSTGDSTSDTKPDVPAASRGIVHFAPGV